MSTVTVFVPYHTPEGLASVPDYPWVRKVLLTDLNRDKPSWSDNCWGEGRLMLSDLADRVEADYVGMVGARAPRKYHQIRFSWGSLEARTAPLLARGRVVALWPSQYGYCPTRNWLVFTEQMHPGMGKAVQLMCQGASIPLRPRRPSLWANDFICHRDVWFDWLSAWRRAFRFVYTTWGTEMPFGNYNIDASRKPAYLLERATAAYFASRDDLEIVTPA